MHFSGGADNQYGKINQAARDSFKKGRGSVAAGRRSTVSAAHSKTASHDIRYRLHKTVNHLFSKRVPSNGHIATILTQNGIDGPLSAGWPE